MRAHIEERQGLDSSDESSVKCALNRFANAFDLKQWGEMRRCLAEAVGS